MSKVYGCSDDIVVIVDDDGTCNEIDCNFIYVEAVVIGFEDGTVIRICYGKNGKGIWRIEIIEKGDASYTLKECDDENAESYSDVFEIESLAVGWGYDYK